MGWRVDHSVSKSPKELWSFGVLEFGLDFGLRLDFCLTIEPLEGLKRGLWLWLSNLVSTLFIVAASR